MPSNDWLHIYPQPTSKRGRIDSEIWVGLRTEEDEMPKAKKKQTPTKTKKSGKVKTTKARKVTPKKTTRTTSEKKTTTALEAITKRKTPPAKVTTKPKRRKLKKYSPRSRYATFRVGDRLMFERIKNWDGDGEIERVIGVVVRKIEDKALGFKFIEVQFDLREHMAYIEDNIRMRRFVVK